MATDPVQTVQAMSQDGPLATRLPAMLRRLAELPASIEPPYLTVSLDWRPQGERPGRDGVVEPEAAQRRGGHEQRHLGPVWRASWEQVGRSLDDLLAEQDAHSATHESLAADIERIRHALEDDVDPAAQGIFIVACSARDVFHLLPLGLPLPTRYTLAPTPALHDLAQAIDDHPPYAILLAEQRQATLTFVSQGRALSELEVDATDRPRHTDQGGLSQQRHQRRADERVEAFAREVAEQTRVALDQSGVRRLVLAADEPVATALTHAFHATVADRVVATASIQGAATVSEQIDATMPLVERHEREREAHAVQEVKDNRGPGGTAVAGSEGVVAALLGGQVMTLVMNDDFSTPGWADFEQGLIGPGEVPTEHPYGGDAAALVDVALERELLRLALQQDAMLEIVSTAVPVSAEEQAHVPDAGSPRPRSDAGKELDALGGVGALLRFALSGDRATAEL